MQLKFFATKKRENCMISMELKVFRKVEEQGIMSQLMIFFPCSLEEVAVDEVAQSVARTLCIHSKCHSRIFTMVRLFASPSTEINCARNATVAAAKKAPSRRAQIVTVAEYVSNCVKLAPAWCSKCSQLARLAEARAR